MITAEEVKSVADRVDSLLNEAFERSKTYVAKDSDWLDANWAGTRPCRDEQLQLKLLYCIRSIALDQSRFVVYCSPVLSFRVIKLWGTVRIFLPFVVDIGYLYLQTLYMPLEFQ